MASRYEISTIFKMIDNFSGPMKSIAGSSTVLAKRVSADMQKTKMQIQAAGQAMKAMAGVAVAAGVALAGKTVVDSVKTYVEFEDAVTKAGSKFKDLDVTSADYQQNLESLQTAAREVGAATMFSATDAAGALDKMAMAGLTSKQSMGMLMGTTNLAVAAGIDLTSAVDMATDAMGAFNMMKDKAGNPLDEKGISNSMNRIADVVAKTTNMANTDMNMWFEAVKMGAPTFTSMGGEIEEFSALVGVLANSGVKGSMAGNAIKNMMLKLSAPAKDGSAALREFGISVFDSEGKMLPFIDIMKQFEGTFSKGTFTNLTAYENALKAATKKGGKGAASVHLEDFIEDTNDLNKLSRLKDIFGTEWIGAFNILLAEGSTGIEKFTNDLKNAGGTAEAIAGAQMQSFSGMIEQLKSAWQDKQLSLGKAFEAGGAKEALQNLITYVQNFDVSQIAAALTQIMQVIPGIVEQVVGFVQTLWNMREIIGALVVAWGLYKVAIIGALVVEKMMAFFTAIKAVQAATEGMSMAQAALNVIMNANPIGLIITGIAALIFVTYECIKHWETWGNVILGLMGPFGFIVNLIMEFRANFEAIKSAFTDGGFLNGIRVLGGTILSAILHPLQSIFELFSNLPLIGDGFKKQAQALESFRQNALTGFGAMDNVAKMQLANSSVPTSVQSLMAGQGNTTSPVTQGERTAYSVSETNNNTSTEVTVTLDKGLKGSASGNAPNVTVQSTSSAAWK